ncbi:MAG: twin-arginine translocation signal domain-containing protein, partial [Planctomycetota bacterium]
MRQISRRSFLKSGMAAATTAVAVPYVILSSALGKASTAAPSERITMGAIGLGGQGMYNLRNFLTCDDLRILAVCDVDT